MKKIFFVLIFLCLFSTQAYGILLFSDNFENSANPDWGNERGNWSVLNGEYYAISPQRYPLSYTSVTTFPNLTDFIVEMNVIDVSDGGVFLRSSDSEHGILLMTGGWNGTHDGLYWHIVTNSTPVTYYNDKLYPGLLGSNARLRIEVIGNTYKAYLNNQSTPVTTLTNDLYSSGKVALYSFSNQRFDNFSISDFTEPIPEPSTIFLLWLGLLGMVRFKK